MKKSYNVAVIMSRAWSIRRNAAAEIGCNVSDVVMSECLRIAWAEAEAVNAPANAAAVAAEWSGLGAGQLDMVRRCIHKAAKNIIGYSTEDHYLQFSEIPAFYSYGDHDLDEFVNEVYIRVLEKIGPAAQADGLEQLTATNERRAAQGKRPLTLVSLVYNAARASISAVYYADSKHSAAYDFEISDGEGNSASYVATCVEDKRANVERAAVIRLRIGQLRDGLDDIGQQVLEMVMQGKTEREIGKAVGISGVAVHKRIVKMRGELADLREA